MKTPLIEFALFSFSCWKDTFSFTVLNLRKDSWDRSLLYVGKQENRWTVEVFFAKLIQQT